MYRFLFLFLLIFADHLYLSSQVTQGFDNTRLLADRLNFQVNKSNDRGKHKEYDGSPYMNDQFLNGVVYARGKVYESAPMRYDIVNDYLEFKQDEGLYEIPAIPIIEKVILGDVVLTVVELKKDGKPTFVKSLAEGKIDLVEKQTILFQEPPRPGALQVSDSPGKYLNPKSQYFIKIHQEFVRVDNTKEVIEHLNNHKVELQKFDKESNKKGSKAEKMAKLINYYNSIDA